MSTGEPYSGTNIGLIIVIYFTVLVLLHKLFHFTKNRSPVYTGVHCAGIVFVMDFWVFLADRGDQGGACMYWHL